MKLKYEIVVFTIPYFIFMIFIKSHAKPKPATAKIKYMKTIQNETFMMKLKKTNGEYSGSCEFYHLYDQK